MGLRIILKPGVLYTEGKQRELSRDALSRQMGVSTATAYRVEKGDVDPSPRFIAALMRLSGKPFEELFEIVGQDAAA